MSLNEPILDEAVVPMSDAAHATDLYQLLNVPRTASTDEIRVAYKRLVRVAHPDRHHQTGDAALIDAADAQFKALTKAHATLTDAKLRALYDRHGARGLADAWALTQHDPMLGNEELHRKVEALRTERAAAAAKSVAGDVRGAVTLGTSLGGWARAARGGDVNVLEQASVAQQLDVPVTADDSVQLGGSVFAEDGTALCAFLVGWRRRVRAAQDTVLYAQARSSGARAALVFGAERALSDALRLTSEVRYVPGALGADSVHLKSKLVRRINDATDAALVWHIGAFEPSVAGKLVRRIGELGELRAKLRVWDDSAALSVSRRFTTPGAASSAELGVKLAARAASTAAAVRAGVVLAVECGGERKLTSRAAVGLKFSFSATQVLATVRLRRDGHVLALPIVVADYADRFVVAATLAAPALALAALQWLVLAPAKRRARARRIAALKAECAVNVRAARKEAEAAVMLLQATVASKRKFEQNVRNGGLIVISAVYGLLDEMDAAEASSAAAAENQDDGALAAAAALGDEAARFDARQAARRRARQSLAEGRVDGEAAVAAAAADAAAVLDQLDASQRNAETEQLAWIDVTTPVQYFVEDSTLRLHAGSKGSLLGFYDPCPWTESVSGYEKQLRIVYRFKGKLHSAEFDDVDVIALPKRSHLVKN